MDKSKAILSDITVHMKYARYDAEKQRRENWQELSNRNRDMHIKRYPSLEEDIREAYKLVEQKKILPSMRSMQFGGKPIELSPNRIYNCAYMPVDDLEAFSETMFLLLEEQELVIQFKITMSENFRNPKAKPFTKAKIPYWRLYRRMG